MQFIFISFKTHKHWFSESLIEILWLVNENRFLFCIVINCWLSSYFCDLNISWKCWLYKVTWNVIYLVNNWNQFCLNQNFSICYYFFDEICLMMSFHMHTFYVVNFKEVVCVCCLFKFIIKNIFLKLHLNNILNPPGMTQAQWTTILCYNENSNLLPKTIF